MTKFEKFIYAITHCELADGFVEREHDMLKNIELDLKDIHRNFEAADAPREYEDDYLIIKKAEKTADWRVYFLKRGPYSAKSYAIYSLDNGVVKIIQLFQTDKQNYDISYQFSNNCISTSYHMIDSIVKPMQYIQNWIKENVKIGDKYYSTLK